MTHHTPNGIGHFDICGPDIGALLLAYRQAGKKLTPKLLDSLSETQK